MKNKNFLFTIGMALMLLLACNIPTFTDNVVEDDFQALSPTPPEASPESSPELSGPVFYVGEDGSDENEGADDSPWLTLQYAVDHAPPGATILVQEGTYAGARIEQSGNADAWIALMAAPGANVTLNEPGPENKHDSILEIETWEGDGIVAYWIIEGFEISNAPSSGIDLRGNEDGHVHHIVVRGNLVHDCGLESGRTGIFNAFADDQLPVLTLQEVGEQHVGACRDGFVSEAKIGLGFQRGVDIRPHSPIATRGNQ